jgi:predicted ATPase
VQSLAQANTVLVTDTVRQLVEWQFQFAPHDTVKLKGLGAPITVYRVIAERPGSERSRPTRPDRMYGREHEQAAMDRCWREVLAGRGQTMLVIGEPGIGKTTLARHFRRTVEAMEGTCLGTGCFAEALHAPLLPIRDLLCQAIGISRLDDIVTVRAKLDATAARDNLDAESVEQILLPLLDPRGHQAVATAATARERQHRISSVLVEWIAGCARLAPLAIVVEDLQWMDAASLELIELLMAKVAATRLCLILTWRPGFETPWTDRTDVTSIHLMRLEDHIMEALVDGMASADTVDAETRRAIAAKSEGNPLFAEELVLLARRSPAGHRRPRRAQVGCSGCRGDRPRI